MGRGCFWAFALKQVENQFHLALPALKLSIEKMLENSWLGRNTNTKPISSKIVLSQLGPFWIKIKLDTSSHWAADHRVWTARILDNSACGVTFALIFNGNPKPLSFHVTWCISPVPAFSCLHQHPSFSLKLPNSCRNWTSLKLPNLCLSLRKKQLKPWKMQSAMEK